MQWKISNTNAMNSGDVSIVNTDYEVKNTGHKHQMFAQRANACNKKIEKSFHEIKKQSVKALGCSKISLKNVNR